MPLFQKSIVNKFLKNQSKELVHLQWNIYKNHFHNPSVQQNIKNSKEEEYQEGFLDDLFVKVLGYTKKPQPNYNLESEKKNITDSKKSRWGHSNRWANLWCYRTKKYPNHRFVQDRISGIWLQK